MTRPRVVFLALLGLGAAAIGAWALAAGPLAAPLPQPPADVTGAQPYRSGIPKEVAALNVEWASKQYRFSTAADAQTRLPFRFKLPKSTTVSSPTTIIVTKGEKSRRTADVYFGEFDGDPTDAITMSVDRDPKRDLVAEIQLDSQLKASGNFKGDRLPQLVRVNGLEGIGAEPGINEGRGLRRGFVSWWDHGVHYEVHGTEGPDGTSLAELLAIAESVY